MFTKYVYVFLLLVACCLRDVHAKKKTQNLFNQKYKGTLRFIDWYRKERMTEAQKEKLFNMTGGRSGTGSDVVIPPAFFPLITEICRLPVRITCKAQKKGRTCKDSIAFSHEHCCFLIKSDKTKQRTEANCFKECTAPEPNDIVAPCTKASLGGVLKKMRKAHMIVEYWCTKKDREKCEPKHKRLHQECCILSITKDPVHPVTIQCKQKCYKKKKKKVKTTVAPSNTTTVSMTTAAASETTTISETTAAASNATTVSNTTPPPVP